ncbi:MAG: RluA family pseudouridine synthase [Candidatus Saccharimonadales bacterium]
MLNEEEQEVPYQRVRLDAYLQAEHPEVSRAQLQRLIKDNKVRVNGTIQHKNGFMLKEHETVTVDFDLSKPPVPDVIDIPILYEDEDCVVITKPLGILSHSKGAFNPEGTVATWLASRPHYNFPREAGNKRSGIVHRLDRATSGVMICAKNQAALTHLQKQFQDRKAKKTYCARIAGELDLVEALIDLPIERNPKQPQRFRIGQNGKASQTNYKVLKTVEQGQGTDSILELKPLTGRTHQLRVHLEYMKHPIVGDTFYEGRLAERLFLHASELEITLPNRSRQTFTSPVPDIFFKNNVS